MITYSNLKAYNQIWSPMGRYPMIDNTIFEILLLLIFQLLFQKTCQK